jgi:hypothetical protein
MSKWVDCNIGFVIKYAILVLSGIEQLLIILFPIEYMFNIDKHLMIPMSKKRLLTFVEIVTSYKHGRFLIFTAGGGSV